MDPLAMMDAVEADVDPLDDDERREADRLASFLRAALPEGRGAELERRAEFPARELEAFAASGLVRALVPSDQGGTLDWARAMRLCSRFAAHDLDVTLCLGGTVLGAIPVLVAGSPSQRARYFGPVTAGAMGGLALSEWAHGSDLARGSCVARRDGEAFVLDGEKSPTNNGTVAANVVVLARTAEGDDAFAHTLFLVPRDTLGVSPVPRFDSVGYRNMDLSGVKLDKVRLGDDAVIGKVGEGFLVARRSLEISRSGVATMAIGAHATALALAVAHADARHLYGAPIRALGGVVQLLSRIAARFVASVALARTSARAIGAFGTGARSLSSAAKLVTPMLLERSVQDAGTLLGARSLMNDLPFARLRRSAPVLAIFDGSSQLQLDELWRHVSAWKPGPARAIPRAPQPFVAEAEDDGVVLGLSPLRVLDGALGAAAAAVHEVAKSLRGEPQEKRFRVSEAAGLLYAVTAMRLAPQTDLVRAAHDAFVSEIAGELAGHLASLGQTSAAAGVLALAGMPDDAVIRALDALRGPAWTAS